MRRRHLCCRTLLLSAGVLVAGAAPASAATPDQPGEQAERHDAPEAPALAFLTLTLVASGAGIAAASRRRTD